MGFWKNDKVPANNTAVNSISAQGNAQANLIDNLVREVLAQTKQFALDSAGKVTVTGTDVISITPSDTLITAYEDGYMVSFIAAGTNTITGVTASVNAIGQEPVKKAVGGTETALAVGDIILSGLYAIRWRSAWDSGNGAWQLISMGTLPQDLRTTASPTFDGLTIGGAIASMDVSLAKASGNLGIRRHANDAFGGGLYLSKSRSATIGNNTIVQAGDQLGSINFMGADGSTYSTAAQISSAVDGTPGAGDMPGSLIISVTPDGGTSLTERLRIKQNGAWRLNSTDGQNGQVVKQDASGLPNWGTPGILTAGGLLTGSTIDVAIPNWVNEIDLLLNVASLSGTDNLVIQIGTGGVPTTTGYSCAAGNYITSGSSVNAYTTGFFILSGVADRTNTGIVFLRRLSGTTWVASGTLTNSNATPSIAHVAGIVSLAGALDFLRLTRSGSNTFDGGSYSLIYR